MEALLFQGLRRPGKRSASIGGTSFLPVRVVVMQLEVVHDVSDGDRGRPGHSCQAVDQNPLLFRPRFL